MFSQTGIDLPRVSLWLLQLFLTPVPLGKSGVLGELVQYCEVAGDVSSGYSKDMRVGPARVGRKIAFLSLCE